MYESFALEKKEEEALEAQSQIGWKEATLGLLSRYWLVIVIMLWYVWSRSIRLEHGNRKDETCISAIYYHYTRIWKARNGVLHSNTTMMDKKSRYGQRKNCSHQGSLLAGHQECYPPTLFQMLGSIIMEPYWSMRFSCLGLLSCLTPSAPITLWIVQLFILFHCWLCQARHLWRMVGVDNAVHSQWVLSLTMAGDLNAPSQAISWHVCPSWSYLMAREGANEPRISADNTNSYHFACSVSIERRIDSSVSIGRRIWRAAPFCIQPT